MNLTQDVFDRCESWDDSLRTAAATGEMRELLDESMELVDQIWHAPSPVRLLSVTALNLTDRWETYEQVDLFSPQQPVLDKKRERLEQAMDAIREKYGANAIAFGDIPECANEIAPEQT